MRKLLLIFAILFAANLFASDIEINGIFYDLKDSKLTASVTFKGENENSFYDEYSGDIVIPETVTYNDKTYTVTGIGDMAFYNCDDVTSVVIPNTVTKIGGWVFTNCKKLTSIHIPASVVDIGLPNKYYLTEITVDENNPILDSRDNCNAVIYTEENTLVWGCSNTVIPNSVTALGSCAYRACSDFTSIVIPQSVSFIDDACFMECENLTEIVCYATTPPTCREYTFMSVPTTIPVYVPANSIDAYKKADEWKNFTNYKELFIYNIAINCDFITNLNCNDVLGDGTVSYNDADKMLTLNNANISGEDYIIDSYQDLTIKCIGNNTITNTLGDGINCERSTTFVGPGSLSVKAKKIAVYSMYDVTIKDGCTLTLECDDWAGLSIADDELTIDGATLIVKGNGESPSISGCNNLILKNGVEIRTNHTYDPTGERFLDADGNIATDDIIIGLPQTDAIDNLTTAEKATKILRDGQVLILRDGVIYNTLGQEFK